MTIDINIKLENPRVNIAKYQSILFFVVDHISKRLFSRVFCFILINNLQFITISTVKFDNVLIYNTKIFLIDGDSSLKIFFAFVSL